MSTFSNVHYIGVDIGSQKTMMVNQEADIILTDTGSVTRPTLASFLGRNRLMGEEAAPQAFSENTVSSFNLLLGRSLDDIKSSELFPHRKTAFAQSSDGYLTVSVNYCGEQRVFSINSLVAMYIAKLIDRVVEVHGTNYRIAFSLPPDSSAAFITALKDSCRIAHLDLNHVTFYSSADCLVATYGRKLSGLRPPERAALEGKNILLIDVGHTSSLAVIVRAHEPIKGGNEGKGPLKLSESFDEHVGGAVFDMKIFDHLAAVCSNKHKSTITPGTKRGSRLLDACERLRKLLSQLPEASTTVENLTDDGDVSFTLKRDDLSSICGDTLSALRTLVEVALDRAQLTSADISGVELLGGGVRMQVVQAVLSSLFDPSMVFGAKLDDCSFALGASLSAVHAATALDVEEAVHAMTEEMIYEAATKETEMQSIDAEVRALLSARNSLEAFVLDMRGAPRRKHGELLDALALNKILDECEDWIYDNCGPDSDTDTITLLKKTRDVKDAVQVLSEKYNEAISNEKKELEKSLDAAANQAAIEKEAAGGDDEDNDNRRLKKADRMRLVTKNKEEGNELFKGGNYRPAAARYHKALTHCAKFFDLSEEDKKEVTAAKLSLFLNLASCYLKLEVWDQVIRNTDDALAIDENNAKAFFRRSSAFEGKKEWDKALADVKRSQELTPTTDKMITAAVERIKKEIQKQKDKEKKMWGGAFK